VAVHRQWHVPVDPECEVVVQYAETLGVDPVGSAFGTDGEQWAAFERLHRGECERCALYGAENMSMPESVGFSVISAG
jgi:hypothetical protein